MKINWWQVVNIVVLVCMFFLVTFSPLWEVRGLAALILVQMSVIVTINSKMLDFDNE
ncbi:hypothetical protein [Arcanobacterium canis]